MVSSIRKQLPNQQQIYDRSPHWVQRVLVNLEAWRRDWFRRHGDYRARIAYFDPAWYGQDLATQEAFQVARLNMLLPEIRKHVPYYRANLPDGRIMSLADLQKLPILEKEIVRREPLALVDERIPQRSLWPLKTSGSTGTPLTFYLDRATVRSYQAVIDAMLALHSCRVGERRARFSGAYVAPFARTEPPFWIYIDHYRQLQCSAYHLAPEFYSHYLRAMRKARVVYGTGYPTAWHQLATHILETGDTPPRLKAIFTDSEGINLDQQAMVERAFGCPVFQTYGTGEVGEVAIQCSQKRYHVLARAAIVELLDDDNQPVKPGETGQIVVTSLAGTTTPFIRYRTGDLATLAPDGCSCGWHSPSWTAIEGRVDDRIKTPDGRWIGRLSHVTKPGVGIRESQIAQIASDRVEIRVVADHNFDPASMEAVVKAAHRYMGETMQVSWKLVDRLPRMRSGKLRHVVREMV